MSFTRDIPNDSQSLLDTRDPIKDNFNTMDTAFKVDHFAMNNAAQGKHQWVRLPQALEPVTGAGEIALINKANALYFKPQNNGTAIALATAGGVTPGFNGSITLFGGVIIKWGQFVSGASVYVPFPVAFPTACWVVTCQQVFGVDTGNNSQISAYAAAGFTIKDKAGNSGFYIAIGN